MMGSQVRIRRSHHFLSTFETAMLKVLGNNAEMAKLVDAPDLGSGAAR